MVCPLFGLDIGGTLVKVVFFEPSTCEPTERIIIDKTLNYLTTIICDRQLEIKGCDINGRRGTLHFTRFATSEVPKLIDSIEVHEISDLLDVVCATGGGAYKFENDIEQKLGIKLKKFDELDTVISGIHYIERFNSPNECYYFLDPLTKNERTQFNFNKLYPYMVVNIGSGVSILSVKTPKSYTRVWGSSIGGGTFEGLCCALLKRQISFDEAIKLADKGCAKVVDKLVRDIYGGDYTRFNLRGDLVASSFGNMNQSECRSQARPEDLARGALEMVTLNIASIARLCASLEKTDSVVFIGNFLRVNSLSMKLLAYALDYWSKGDMKALFLEHEGYFGALGSLVENCENLQI